MEFWNRLLKQLSALWERWTPAQRAGIVAAAAVCALAVGSVGVWATRPEYVTISHQLSPQQAAEIVSTLESENIRYQLNFAGSAISVPRPDVSRARIALREIISPVEEPEMDLGDGIWADPALHQARMTRQLESRLARSISQLTSVRSATVHLTQGETSPFIRQRTPSKASVILELQPNTMFSAADARSIVSLVAHSVEQLTPEHVTVLDTAGRLLSGAQGADADVVGQISYRTHLESDLASKAEAILTQMLGPGRAVVRVTADVDFTQVQRKSTRFDPDLKVKVSETIQSESRTGSSLIAGGAAGTASNLKDLDFKSGGSGPVGSKTENTTTTYENARTEDTVQELPGRIKRLTVAAVVQLPEEESAEGQTGATASVTRDQVEAIIKQAVGFDAGRQDQIEVVAAALAGSPELLVPAMPSPWEQLLPLLQSISLGLASLVALFLGLRLLRRMKPIVVETDSRETLSPQTVLQIAELARMSQDNPNAAAEVLRSWLEAPVSQTGTRKEAA